MPRAPKDPIRVAAASGVVEPAAWARDPGTLGLPECPVRWRRLGALEAIRAGDYYHKPDEDRWYAAGAWAGTEVGLLAGSMLIWRPMGDSSSTWFVGANAAAACATGSADFPFLTVDEALDSLPADAVGVIVEKGTGRLLHALDPADWSWERYLETAAEKAQVVEPSTFSDRLTALTKTRLTKKSVLHDDYREAVAEEPENDQTTEGH